MEQTASTALIAAIVAVVLAALGLVGGVIGYVQGTAALRRATLIRQRASAAEEAALQARSQAEQSARTAQQLLDRLDALQVRSLGDVADLPTGPLILPSRAAPVSFAPSLTPPTGGAPLQRPATAPVPTPAVQTPAYFNTGPVPTAAPVEPQPVEPEPTPVEPEPLVARTVPEPVPDPTPEPVSAVAQPEPPVDAEVEPEPEPPVDAEPEPEPEPAPAARSATGQVTAGLQDAPPMDWQEALRTGAIPLPAVSRGTYAAPRKKSDRDPAAPVRFELRAVGRQKYEAVNLGGFTAEQALVEGTGDDKHLVRPEQTTPVAVEAGKALAFSVTRVEGRRISVRVTWLRPNGRPTSVQLPLP